MAPSKSELASLSAKIIVTTIIVILLMVASIIVISFMIALLFLALLLWSNSNNEDSSTTTSWRRHTIRHGPPAAAAVSAARRRGHNPSALWSYNAKDFKDVLECAICLSEVTQGEKIRLLPKCNHGFHLQCTDMWFHAHSTCPLCRNHVLPSNNGDDLQENDVFLDSESDEHHSSYPSSAHSTEPLPFRPTNVLFRGVQNTS